MLLFVIPILVCLSTLEFSGARGCFTTHKKRKREAPSPHDTTSHWFCMEILFLKLAATIFWPGLIALPLNTLPI